MFLLTFSTLAFIALMLASGCTLLTPIPTRTIDPEQAYRSRLSDLSFTASDALTGLGKRLRNPALDNPVWVRDVRERGKHLVAFHEEALELVPGPEWEDVHTTFLLGMEHVGTAGTLAQRAMDMAEQGREMEATLLLNKAMDQLGEANMDIEYALTLIEELSN